MKQRPNQRSYSAKTSDYEHLATEIEKPKESCKDNKCPYHGRLKVRQRSFKGLVISTDLHRSATVEWERKIFIKKYERYEKRKSSVRVHNPTCIDAKEGDFVTIYECRPLSKTKHFVIIEKTGKDILFKQKLELKQQAKVKEQIRDEVHIPDETTQIGSQIGSKKMRSGEE